MKTTVNWYTHDEYGQTVAKAQSNSTKTIHWCVIEFSDKHEVVFFTETHNEAIAKLQEIANAIITELENHMENTHEHMA